MNGIHDMGGMHGFGPVRPEPDEPIFHAPWEKRALALTLAMAAWGKWNIDASRHARERIPPAAYLNYTYYERWIAALTDMMVEHGLISADEAASGTPDPNTAKAEPPLTPERVGPVLRRGGPSARPLDRAPRFAVGDRVRAKNLNPEGHTRLPRYARGKVGEVVRDHGGHVFPDSNAHFRGEDPQPLYAVRFTARELWGPDAHPRDTVTLDLWEPYLDAV
ncbi:nitrile hydratase subunit beta [Caenispirillum salinarum]|uniref:nitrile hydratase subunit beta n=1 Tax=Caenispirillum salinarum TaxID=859058 RepID=UPI00384B7664